jgi:hypothetical protein
MMDIYPAEGKGSEIPVPIPLKRYMIIPPAEENRIYADDVPTAFFCRKSGYYN